LSSGKGMKSYDIVGEVLDRKSIFKNPEALYPEYIPSTLPYREKELMELAKYFRPVILNPGSICQKVFIHSFGKVGVGKTVTSIVFGKSIEVKAREKGVNIKYVHINCHKARTLYAILQEIAKGLNLPVSPRGLSPLEIYSAINDFLEDRNMIAIIALDEFDYFVEYTGSDAAYFLIRTYDENPEAVKRLNFILIARSLSSLSYLDSATRSYLLRHTIPFKPYTSAALKAILEQRRDEAFIEGVVPDEVLEIIADAHGVDKGGEGNARAAIEALRIAGLLAESEGSGVVTLEHARRGIAETDPSIVYIKDVLLSLSLHELLIYKAIIEVLEQTGARWARMGEVEEAYEMLCEVYGERPRAHTQVYEYIRNLKRLNLIDTKISGKGYRGKTTLISVNAPLSELKKEVSELIEKMMSWGKVR